MFNDDANDVVFLVVVEDADRGVVIVTPAYYDTDAPTAREMLKIAV